MSRLARPLLAVLVALLAAGALIGPAHAKGKAGYCAKAIKKAKAKVYKRTGGLIVYQSRGSYGACNEQTDRNAPLGIFDTGAKIQGAAAAKGKCVAIVTGGKEVLPEITFKEMRANGASGIALGYDATAGRITSLTVASNCAAAWGEQVTENGATTYTVRAKGITSASDVPSDSTLDVATVQGPADLKTVKTKAVGRKLQVDYTLGGAPQSTVVPTMAAAAAKKRKPSCAKLIKRTRYGKVVARDNGVSVYQENNTIGVCDNRLRKLQDMAILNEGTKVSEVVAVRKRCALILATGKGASTHPVLYFKDFKRDAVVTQEAGYGGTDPASIDSIALASNCGAAWGEFSDGLYRVFATAINGRSDLGDVFTTVATVAGAADIRTVTAKAVGRKVKVGWTAAGAPQTATLPAG